MVEEYPNANNFRQDEFDVSDGGRSSDSAQEDDVESESNEQRLFDLDLEGGWEAERPLATTSDQTPLPGVEEMSSTRFETSWHNICNGWHTHI